MSSREKTRRKGAVTDPIETVNRKSDEAFIEHHLNSSGSPWTTTWTHPKTNANYSLNLMGAGSMSKADLQACFDLVEETSRPDYEASTMGWKPASKMAEMKSPELRYILVKSPEGLIHGFTSLMPTYEEGEPVVYCYEIHLKPELQGSGLGRLLMSFLETVAANTPPIGKVMLTCYLSNERALAFYKTSGFVVDPISPVARKLRFGREFVPDYVIMSKKVDGRSNRGGEKDEPTISQSEAPSEDID
ncbi:acyl-CoA N-acyltransferase [Xylariaceae sp. FL0594]|nr:acyl-CoA N-acyltransferase [Xylariaceae sp. FL0594]